MSRNWRYFEECNFIWYSLINQTTELFLLLMFSMSSAFLKASTLLLVSSVESSKSSSPERRISESPTPGSVLGCPATRWYLMACLLLLLGFFIRKLSVTQNISTYKQKLVIAEKYYYENIELTLTKKGITRRTIIVATFGSLMGSRIRSRTWSQNFSWTNSVIRIFSVIIIPM